MSLYSRWPSDNRDSSACGVLLRGRRVAVQWQGKRKEPGTCVVM
jgi:hypothetical protein